tara:strand:- start:61 stop:498 length:438 start_codon:yes stop_codon:yes gene_type:complete
MKKKFLPIIFITFWSCENEVSSEANPLIGDWDLVSTRHILLRPIPDTIIFDVDGINTYQTRTLADNGVFNYQGYLNGGLVNGGGTWVSSDTTLTFIEMGSGTNVCDYTMDDDDNWFFETTSYDDVLGLSVHLKYGWTRKNHLGTR